MKKAVGSLRAPMAAFVLLYSCGDGQVDDSSDEDIAATSLPRIQALGDEVTLNIGRDTSVRSESPNTNEGTLPLLSGSRSLLAVDSAELAAAVGSQDVLLSATLHLTPPAGGQPSNTLVGLYRTSKSWTELGATYSCAVDSDTSNHAADCSGANVWSMDLNPPNPWVNLPTTAALLQKGSKKVVDLNVTGDVQRFLSAGGQNDGWLLLSGLVGTANAVFQSREGAAPPTLTLSVRRCGPEVCDDGNSCTEDLCDADGFCSYEPVAQGAACDDGDACTVGEQCSAESCVPTDVVACGADAQVVINEVESSSGVPGDWIELYNAGTHPVDLSGWALKDSDDTHNYAIAAGSVLAPGAYLVVEELALDFGLGGADAARLYDASATLIDSYAWTSHAAVTYGRCPNGSGEFADNASATKGSANDCTVTPVCTPGEAGCAVVLNELESNGGVPGDWIELYNQATTSIDVSGWVLKDSDDTHIYTLPANSVLAPESYLVVEELSLAFGLGSGDAARLFRPDATLADSYVWTSHAATTYGRCPNGTGPFTTTTSSTKGAANDCTPSGVTFTAWPGAQTVSNVDAPGTFVSNLSGLSYEPASGATAAILWGVVNGPSLLQRLQFDGTNWVPSLDTKDWQAGKTLLYPSGTGSPDAEGLSRAEFDSPAIYVASERDNDNDTVSRLSVLRYDTSAAGGTLTATNEWNLTTDLPASGPNTGLEAIAWVPDSDLVSRGFKDDSTGALYNPALYPSHGSGVFFVGLETQASLYGYVLNHADSTFHRIATVASGQPLTMDLSYDRSVGQLWSYCDDACGNRGTILRVQTDISSVDVGKLTVRGGFERPSSMPNLANEGIAVASEAECVAGQKPFFWADDSDTDGISIRQGTVQCGPLP